MVAGQSRQDLLTLLGTERARVLENYDRIPLREREVSPGPDRWSAAEVVEHLALTDATVIRVLRLASTRSGPFPGDAPAAGLDDAQARAVRDRSRRLDAPDRVRPQAGISPQAALDHLLGERRKLLSALSQAPDGLLDAAHLPHPALGEVSLRGWIEFLGHHDARHAAQLGDLASRLPD